MSKSQSAESSPPAITSSTANNNDGLVKLPQSLQIWRPTILSYSASIGSVALGYPLDSIKSRMQTHGFPTITQCLVNTVKNEGVRGLFRGISSPIFSIAFSRSLNVSVFSFVKPYTSHLSLGLKNVSPIVDVIGNNLPSSFLAGFSAGFVTSLWACPFEFVKLFSQISYLENKTKIGNIKALQQIWKSSRGPLGLYTGYKFQFLRDTFGAAVYFTSYETFKLLLNHTMSDENDRWSILKEYSNNWVSIALAGGMSGSLCWLSIFPFDTLKSLQQKALITLIVRKEEHTIDTLKLRNNIYRGVSASVLRSFFTSMVFFSAYEYLMKVVT